ncbi:uncharacterized protein KZ484_013148 [Pholidichthys leucotaenia]
MCSAREQPASPFARKMLEWLRQQHKPTSQLQVAKCCICSTELSYFNKSASSMLRHYRARHENEVPDTPRIDAASSKQVLDEAVLNFIVKDHQPLSIVESEGFRELVQALQPSCFANQKDHQTNGGEKVRGGTGTSEKGSTARCGSEYNS